MGDDDNLPCDVEWPSDSPETVKKSVWVCYEEGKPISHVFRDSVKAYRWGTFITDRRRFVEQVQVED
jgi:hypothetical protein